MWASDLPLDSTGMPSPKSIMTSIESVATLNLDGDVDEGASLDTAAMISVQLELLSGSECNVISATATLTEMIRQDRAIQEEIRTAGGVRSAVFLHKLSQTTGNQRIANASSRLLLHLARDNPRNQDELSTFEGITLMDVVLRIARLGDGPRHSRELLEMTRAARYW